MVCNHLQIFQDFGIHHVHCIHLDMHYVCNLHPRNHRNMSIRHFYDRKYLYQSIQLIVCVSYQQLVMQPMHILLGMYVMSNLHRSMHQLSRLYVH